MTPPDTDMCPYSLPSGPPFFFAFLHYLILDASSVAVALCLKSVQSWPVRALGSGDRVHIRNFFTAPTIPIPIPLLTAISLFPSSLPSHTCRSPAHRDIHSQIHGPPLSPPPPSIYAA